MNREPSAKTTYLTIEGSTNTPSEITELSDEIVIALKTQFGMRNVRIAIEENLDMLPAPEAPIGIISEDHHVRDP